MSNLVVAPRPSVREAVKGSGPITAVVTGPVSSLVAAVVKVPANGLVGLGAGIKDAFSLAPAQTGLLKGYPRIVQNAADFAGTAVVGTGVAAILGTVFHSSVGPLELGAYIALWSTAPGAQVLDGMVKGAKEAVVSGYTFAKTKLGNC